MHAALGCVCIGPRALSCWCTVCCATWLIPSIQPPPPPLLPSDPPPLLPDAPGSFAWASPEQLMGERCTYSSDVWSLGVTFWVRAGVCLLQLLLHQCC